jgi:pyridoxamine 5'-phosphate oxidase
LRIVFASRNPHKLEQAARVLDGIDLIPLDEVAPDLILDEPFDSFLENARAKAVAVTEGTGLPAVADDSGIEVDALGGAPGVRSARYAGVGATDEDNNRKLVAALKEVPERDRTCRYRCVAVLALPDGRELAAEGLCEGRIVLEGRGSMGFGYDPHVIPDGDTRTMGQIPLDEKLAFNHRGRAFRSLLEKIRALETSEQAEHMRIERDLDSLDEADADPDPFRQFEVWLRKALDEQPGEPNAMTLATSTRDGLPSARTVLLRGFDNRGFVFYTNYESRKGRELDENPRAALVFCWTLLQRQVCIVGRVTKTPLEESSAYFRSRPVGHRLSAWASPQSRIIAGRAELEERMRALGEQYASNDDIPLPPYWGGFRVVPDSMEFWQGRPNRLHDRLRYTRTDEGGWRIERLAP